MEVSLPGGTQPDPAYDSDPVAGVEAPGSAAFRIERGASSPTYLIVLSIRFASDEAGSSASARSSSARAAGDPGVQRYVSPSAIRAAAESALQIEIFQRVDRFLGSPGAEKNPADEQVCLRLVRRQVNRAPQLDQRLPVLFALISRRPRSRWKAASSRCSR